MEQKRNLLKDMSETAKMMMELDPDKGGEHQEFHTFKGWKEKGSKAFFIWSAPRRVSKKNEVKEEDSKSYTMYGVAHLFSNAQVKPIIAE